VKQTDVENVLKDPLAQELMASSIPARLAYTGEDERPRVIPIGFLWDGTHFIVCTLPGSPKVRALALRPEVALTIDTVAFPPNVLLVRGRATAELVAGVPAEYLTASRKAVPPDQWQSFEESVRALYEQMTRIVITPHWAKLLDFVTRLPSPVEELVRRQAGSQGA
jgi:Pyridoxamine 5'-phosphate oxidase